MPNRWPNVNLCGKLRLHSRLAIQSTYRSYVDVGHSYTCGDYLRDTNGGTAFNTLKNRMLHSNKQEASHRGILFFHFFSTRYTVALSYLQIKRLFPYDLIDTRRSTARFLINRNCVKLGDPVSQCIICSFVVQLHNLLPQVKETSFSCFIPLFIQFFSVVFTQ